VVVLGAAFEVVLRAFPVDFVELEVGVELVCAYATELLRQPKTSRLIQSREVLCT